MWEVLKTVTVNVGGENVNFVGRNGTIWVGEGEYLLLRNTAVSNQLNESTDTN